VPDQNQPTDQYAWVKKLPLPDQVRYFESMLEKRTAALESANRDLQDLRNPQAETPGQKAERIQEERADRAHRREQARNDAAAAELQRARAAAIRAIAKLLPEAIRQAKAKPPRPALLRLILRATR